MPFAVIGRNHHDVIAQSLTGINVRLGSLKSEAAANVEDLQKKIALTQRLVEKSVETIHRFARDLRPTLLDDLGLIPALHSYLKTFMERTGIRAELAAFSGVEKLDITRRTILYRVALEALANVARHSKASRVKVTVRDLMGSVVMEIHDNGKGFQVDGSDWARGGERLGLLGMRERVEMVGGAFAVESVSGQQTTVRVTIPDSPIRRKRATTQKSTDSPLPEVP